MKKTRTRNSYLKQTHNLRIFGEVGILFNKSKIRGEMYYLGETCVFVGYSKNNGSEVYRIYKPGTKNVVHSRNVIWMGIIYGDYINEKKKKKLEPFMLDLGTFDDNNDDDLQTGREYSHEKIRNEKEMKKLRALKKLNTSYNPTLRALETTNFAFVGGDNDDYNNPATFNEAWNFPIEKDRGKWRNAICKESHGMIWNKVWRRHKKGNVPSNRRLIGHKWVFKVK